MGLGDELDSGGWIVQWYGWVEIRDKGEVSSNQGDSIISTAGNEQPGRSLVTVQTY